MSKDKLQIIYVKTNKNSTKQTGDTCHDSNVSLSLVCFKTNVLCFITGVPPHQLLV